MLLSLKQRLDIPCGFNLIRGTIFWFNNDPKVNIFIPDDPVFTLIKGNVIEGNGLRESYKRTGDMLYMIGKDNCDLESFPGYPSATLDMPVKFFIFDAVDFINGAPVSRPYVDGTWIHEQASNILQMYFLGAMSKTGRLELEPGVILPTQSEGTCIKNAIRYSNKSIEEAFNQCGCANILPTRYLESIENLIKTTSYTLFYSYMIAITLSQRPELPIIPEKEPDQNLPGTTNYSQYLPLGLLALLLILGRRN